MVAEAARRPLAPTAAGTFMRAAQTRGILLAAAWLCSIALQASRRQCRTQCVCCAAIRLCACQLFLASQSCKAFLYRCMQAAHFYQCCRWKAGRTMRGVSVGLLVPAAAACCHSPDWISGAAGLTARAGVL